MAKGEKLSERDKAFNELIKLYDFADDFENEGEDEKAKSIRKIIAKVEVFVLKQKK